jgi:hypothetical protein
VSDESVDFRGKLLVDKSYSYRSQFVEQLPITDLAPYLEASFAKGVKAIKWQQYVPGFNDGDPCEFTINEVYFTGNDEVAKLWAGGQSVDYLEDENTYHDLDYLEDYVFALFSYSDHPDGLTIDADVPIGSAAFEYAVRAEFGDNTEIVITPEATYTFDYECGH